VKLSKVRKIEIRREAFGVSLYSAGIYGELVFKAMDLAYEQAMKDYRVGKYKSKNEMNCL
jgi:hypothetical protein